MKAIEFDWAYSDKAIARQLRLADELMIKLAGAGKLGRLTADLINSGGKRLRPAITLTAAALGTPKDEVVIQAAAAVEFTHLASLVHDDLLDKSAWRRHKPSAAAALGHGTALLLGDYLLTKASLAAAADERVVRLIAEAAADMAEGEAAQFVNGADPTPLSRGYFVNTRQKTASLFAAAAGAGAVCAGLPPEEIDALSHYAEAFGMAFQLIDDILDQKIGRDQMPRALAEIKRYNEIARKCLADISKPTGRLEALPLAYLDWASPL